VGSVLLGVGTLGLTLNLPVEPDYWGSYFPWMILTGCGVGLSISTLSSSATVFLKPTQLAMGSALNTTGRQIGTALGAALSLAIAAPALARIEQWRMAGSPIDGNGINEIHTAWNMNAGIYFLAGIVMIIIFRAPTESQMDDARAKVAFED
jgi:MFS family permease